MLAVGQQAEPAVTLTADIYSHCVLMMEHIGTQQREFPHSKSTGDEREGQAVGDP